MQQTQYPQTARYQQPNQEFYIPPRKKHTFISIGLIIIVLFGAAGLYFAIKPKLTGVLNDNTPENTAINDAAPAPDLQAAAPIPRVEITSLKLCDAVDENFVCTENTDRVFKRGDTFYVYAEVFATSANINNIPTIQLKQELDIKNENGNILSSEAEDLTQVTDTNYTYILPLSKKITFTDEDPMGKGTITIGFTDKNTDLKTTKEIGYEII